MKLDRLFLAIGGVDLRLVEDSEREPHKDWLKWSLSAAACLALALSLWFFPWQEKPIGKNPSNDSTSETIQLTGSAVGELHLLQFQPGPEEAETPSDFILYINESLYRGSDQEGRYVIEPIIPPPEALPVCSLEIAHWKGVSPEAAAETIQSLKSSYAQVSAVTASNLVDGLSIHGSNGSDWNAEQLDAYFVDDRQGGAFVLTARYFTEATEGHGARFSDMIGTFQAVTPAAESSAPTWLTDLKRTVDRLIPAVFSNQATEVSDLLNVDGQIGTYGSDVAGEVSIRSIDYAFDDDRAPSSAVVSVKHRLSMEDSYSYLTIELSYIDKQWRVDWTGLEK